MYINICIDVICSASLCTNTNCKEFVEKHLHILYIYMYVYVDMCIPLHIYVYIYMYIYVPVCLDVLFSSEQPLVLCFVYVFLCIHLGDVFCPCSAGVNCPTSHHSGRVIRQHKDWCHMSPLQSRRLVFYNVTRPERRMQRPPACACWIFTLKSTCSTWHWDHEMAQSMTCDWIYMWAYIYIHIYKHIYRCHILAFTLHQHSLQIAFWTKPMY